MKQDKKENKKQKKEKLLKIREQELFTFCYENEIRFEQYEKYHYRLFLNNKCVDVWPISKKFYNNKMCSSKTYSSPNEIIVYLK